MTERSPEKTQKLERPIDMEIRVKYQHVESQQSEKNLQSLVKFLSEQTLHSGQTHRREGGE